MAPELMLDLARRISGSCTYTTEYLECKPTASLVAGEDNGDQVGDGLTMAPELMLDLALRSLVERIEGLPG